jgi:hypothetical protein
MPYGSKVEVLGGTVAAVNGPHPQKAHSDEVEIMRADTWRESRNLASAKTTPDGRHITAQNYATSTMKWKGGRVWQTLESFKRAKEKAIERFGDDKALVDDLITKTTTFYVLIWCIFEVAEQVPNCREAPENAHLPEWEPGLERSECKCDCNDIVNGTLEQQDENGQPLPRTLASECQGRFYRSRGHRTRAEVIQLFLQNDERTWAAQQLCRETETEGLYIPQFSRQRHGLSRFPLDVANGPIYSGTDWGFTDEAAVLWIQYLERPVEAVRYDGTVIVVPRGARVALSELTIAQKTATELGQLAILREIKLANVLSAPRVQIRKRWADLQGAGDRRDWAKMGLKTARYSTRNFDEHVKEWRGIVDADRFFVVVDEDRFTGMGCPMLCEQIEGWREEDGKESRELPSTSSRPGATSSTACTTSTWTPARSRPSRSRPSACSRDRPRPPCPTGGDDVPHGRSFHARRRGRQRWLLSPPGEQQGGLDSGLMAACPPYRRHPEAARSTGPRPGAVGSHAHGVLRPRRLRLAPRPAVLLAEAARLHDEGDAHRRAAALRPAGLARADLHGQVAHRVRLRAQGRLRRRGAAPDHRPPDHAVLRELELRLAGRGQAVRPHVAQLDLHRS